MQTIAIQLDSSLVVVECIRSRPWPTMIKSRHRVEEVREVRLLPPEQSRYLIRTGLSVSDAGTDAEGTHCGADA